MRLELKLALAAIMLALLPASPVIAATLFDARIDATLKLVSIEPLGGDGAENVTVDGAATLFDGFATFDGAAFADWSAMLSPDTLTPLGEADLTSITRAFGDTSGIGSAFSVAATDGLVLIGNVSPTDSFRLNFQLDYTIQALASVDDPSLEGAFASAILTLASSQEFDPLLYRDLIADTAAGETGGTATDTLFFSFDIAPESEGSLSLVTDVQGFAFSDLATAPIPEPATWAMMICGFGLVGWTMRRRRAIASYG